MRAGRLEEEEGKEEAMQDGTERNKRQSAENVQRRKKSEQAEGGCRE